MRNDFLEKRLNDYLARRSMPRGFEGKPEALKGELQALMRCVSKFAPRERYDEWFDRFEEVLAEDAKTRAWPTEGEVKAAAMAIRPSSSTGIIDGTELDPIKINAGRIERGEPVGDQWLFGRLSVELLNSGRVSMAQLRPYRSALYFAEKALVGEDVAKQREADRLARHEAAS